MLNLNYLGPRTGKCLWRCPQCEELIRLESQLAVSQAERAGGCQGCRAKKTFQTKPGLISFYLDFWISTDAWPQSHSWIEALPVSGVAMIGSACQDAGVQPLTELPAGGQPHQATKC